jgi:hypothetical protein
MLPLRRFFVALPAAALLTACGGSQLQSTGAVSLNTGGASADAYLEGTGSEVPGSMRLKASACQGEALAPDYTPLTEAALVKFLTAHGYESRLVRARSDLVYVDVTNAGDHPVRLRVAILNDPPAAGKELHEAILQHGQGSWGVHRSNLAVLAPIGEPGEVVSFAVKTKLACWGVLTMAGLDDTFVIPGGYIEL